MLYIKEEHWNEHHHEKMQKYLSVLKSDGIISQFALKVSRIEDHNWNAEWEQTVQPVEVSDRLIVRPSWHSDRPEWKDKLVLLIDPEMAFGTGFHESTRLALRLLERVVRQADDVLDVGTGTGILAIAAANLGASKVVAIDSDPWAYANALENVKRNGASDSVVVRLLGLDALPPGDYNTVVVNITKNVILENMSLLAAKMSTGGRMILSGLLQSDMNEVLEELRLHRLKIVEIMIENEWMGIAAERE